MSWDIVLFSYKERISSFEEIDELLFEPTDFCFVLESHFDKIVTDGDHKSIKGKDFEIEYFNDNGKEANKILNLYGENGFYEIIILAKKYNWQIFDTSSGEMIDLENPANNGCKSFQEYLSGILRR
ncbi:MAG: hypothetical protein JST87_12190 [Bacteroidetes bacterium]|nr:hypothetical protein [Bacteroidota bacterium]